MNSVRRVRAIARRAGAMVEIAVCLPIILTVITGTVSVTSLIYLKQSLKIACYEACRVGIVPQAKTENVHQQVVEILDARGVKDYTITINPSNIANLTTGSFLTVTVDVPTASNSPLLSSFLPAGITQSVSMMSEE